ncbi:MAG TPA: ABC transporter permease [Vicinamibacterales bacterium]
MKADEALKKRVRLRRGASRIRTTPATTGTFFGPNQAIIVPAGPARRLQNRTAMHTLVQDIRFAIRSFSRTPGVTLVAVATLALGIGANTAIFSVIYNVLVAPLPYPGADRVALVWRQNARLGGVSVSPTMSDVERWRTSPGIESMTMYTTEPMVLTGADAPETLDAARVAPNLLDFTGTRPIAGRPFSPDDAASEAAGAVALISEPLWKRRFGADPRVIGSSIELGDRAHVVVGVLPAAFRLPLRDVDVVVPLTPPPAGQQARPARRAVSALARVKRGVTLAEAEAQLAGAAIDNVTPDAGWRVHLMPPGSLPGDSFRRTVLMLFGAVGCVLLIACANVAHLVLARNAARRREIAVRVAIGASTARLVRQLVTENVALAVTGGVAGVMLAMWGVDAISAVRPPQMPQLANLAIGPQAFVFALAVSVATGLFFGTLPALAAARRGSAAVLKQGTQPARGVTIRRALSVAEVALSLVLLSAAALLIQSYANLTRADLGFSPAGVISVKLDLPASRYRTPEAQADAAERLAALVREVPGVTRAVLASGAPPNSGLIFAELQIEGIDTGQRGPSMLGGGAVGAGFFEALRIPAVDGRTFVADDARSSNVIVNETTAKRYWPGMSAVGKHVRLGEKGPWNTIVGVVGDVKTTTGDAGALQFYMPLGRFSASPDSTLLVAATRAPRDVIPAIRAQAWSIDPKLALDQIETLEDSVAETNARPRFNVVLLSVFAAIGLSLALVGVYGVISYGVGLRTREIGVRVALGATSSAIRRSVLAEATLIAGIGVAVGIAGALASGRYIESMLNGIRANDPATLCAVAGALYLTAVLAAWIPARRATRVDPMVALRSE